MASKVGFVGFFALYLLSTSNMYVAFGHFIANVLVICNNSLVCVQCSVSNSQGRFTLLPSCGITKKYFDSFSLLLSFTDFAVGAPYHNTGRVSIWMGSNKGISQTPSQVRWKY